jgi:hypothetical protein
MSLVSTITVDLSANTVTLNCTDSSTLVENIVFNLSANTVTFSITPGVTISDIDFDVFTAQIKVFQTAILSNFNVNQFQTSPFTKTQVIEAFVSFVAEWILQIGINSAANFISYTAAQGTSQVTFNARGTAQTLNFSEWMMVYPALNHYQVSVGNYLG